LPWNFKSYDFGVNSNFEFWVTSLKIQFNWVFNNEVVGPEILESRRRIKKIYPLSSRQARHLYTQHTNYWRSCVYIAADGTSITYVETVAPE
jgi:hypothetical protein